VLRTWLSNLVLYFKLRAHLGTNVIKAQKTNHTYLLEVRNFLCLLINRYNRPPFYFFPFVTYIVYTRMQKTKQNNPKKTKLKTNQITLTIPCEWKALFKNICKWENFKNHKILVTIVFMRSHLPLFSSFTKLNMHRSSWVHLT